MILRAVGAGLAIALVFLLIAPVVGLALSVSIGDLRGGIASPLFGPALALSARTTGVSLLWTVGMGTPLAWWLARSRSPGARLVGVLTQLPVVIPPAVIGLALLETFGREGLMGPALSAVGVSLPFTERAVVVAQVVVSTPFFVQAAASAFRRVDPDMLIVARTLGATPVGAFFRVAVPAAWPGLVAGASLAWARALGEFGATLLFAGSMPGRTQTMPLAIFAALESDVQVAVVFALILAALGVLLLGGLRLAGVQPSESGS